MRVSQTQRQRTQDDPLLVGTFSQLSIRNLKGSLGPKNQVVGRADTRFNSNGGFGGGTYNHWFQFNITSPAWIIIAKGGTRPQYIQVSAYDLNLSPIQSRMIFDKDSLVQTINNELYNPYTGHIMGDASTLYNNFDPSRLDEGNSLYFPLQLGAYLLCVSTTRNEPIDYEVAVVVEFPTKEFDLVTEDYFNLLYEDDGFITADVTENFESSDLHSHSLSDWEAAWQREHPQDVPFPSVLVPLATQP